ncbi:hypothetical protein FORC37_4142 [Vibrio vulnificus]|nr:hypothetical protein FORC16_4165 [Vibrio vulnificus]ASC59836.1 hypothetical protein FORC37_4142 [Vibrio vulnificus]
MLKLHDCSILPQFGCTNLEQLNSAYHATRCATLDKPKLLSFGNHSFTFN